MDQGFPKRKTHELSHGRVSRPGAIYFVTFCTANRRPGLDASGVAPVIIREATAAIGGENILIGTVMPDHLHLLFRLGSRLTLSQTIARTKSRTAKLLEAEKVSWQRGSFERRVRENESPESFALYVFLNSYRAHLIDATGRWPWTFLGESASFRFVQEFNAHGGIRTEWLGASSEWEQSLGFPLGD